MKQNEILFFLGSILIVVLSWIAFTLVHTSLTSTISATTIQAIVPINGTFDTKTIDAMRIRPQILPVVNLTSQTAPSVVSTVGPAPTPISTSSSTLATSGGTLR